LFKKLEYLSFKQQALPLLMNVIEGSENLELKLKSL